jgi:hypothetical protein
MKHDTHEALTNPGRFKLPGWYYPAAGVLALAGFGVFGWSLSVDSHRAWGGYLIGFYATLLLALAGPFFVAAQYLAGAGWSVSVRRIPEAMSAFLLPAAALAAGVFAGAHHLYHWAHPGVIEDDLVLLHKAPYLNITRMGVSVAIGFVVWIALSTLLSANSRAQDSSGDARLTHRNAYLSALFMVLFALTFSVASFDFVMSLEPHWFSTMWAVYMFSMMMQVGMAFIAMAVSLLRKTGQLDGFVNDAHVHDLGKFAFAFAAFHAYIAFCQFLLIWYANLPEETIFFIKRFDHGWQWVALALPFVKFMVPFFVLLPWRAKHTGPVLVGVGVWTLLVTTLELWWLVMPALTTHGPELPWIEFAIFGGFFGIFLLAFGFALSRHAAVPVKDPRLAEAVHHHL